MKASVTNNIVWVRLSKRNVLSLMHKLEMEKSERTLERSTENGLHLIITVEDDEEHYGTRKPGMMHPETERFIEEKNAA